MALVSQKTALDPKRTQKHIRLPDSLVEPFEAAVSEAGCTQTAFILNAIKDKLSRDKREKAFEERYVASLNRLEKQMRGLRTANDFTFNAVTTFLKTFLRYFPEPAPPMLRDNEMTLDGRLEVIIGGMIAQCKSDGFLDEAVEGIDRPRAIAAMGD